MSTFNGAIWNGGGTGETPSVGVPLSSLIMPAYRLAGITNRAGIIPSDDMFLEAIPELNRMIGQWNCERPKIFTIRTDQFPLVASQKVYTVGPGADFDMARPQAIQNGVICLSDPSVSGAVRMPPMYQMDDSEWAGVRLQDIPSGVPLAFYFDGSYDTSTGYGLIYLYPQTQSAYWVEWYTWQAIPVFQTKDDNVALPPGYESAIVHNLAVRLALLNPKMASMDPRTERVAREALAAIEHKNAPTPLMSSDFHSSGRKTYFDWRSGMLR